MSTMTPNTGRRKLEAANRSGTDAGTLTEVYAVAHASGH
jgi:hypothetical protein